MPFPGEQLEKSGNRDASLAIGLYLREWLDVMAKSNMCHLDHQSKKQNKNYSKPFSLPLNLSRGYTELFWREARRKQEKVHP